MISICIPVYNFSVVNLVEDLIRQGKSLNVPYEIIVIDDCSLEEFRRINHQLKQKVNFILLDKNVGRAKIRNAFLKYTKYEYLLFLDCDSTIISDHFLSDYTTAIQQNNSFVICGGRIYDKNPPGRNKLLRWKYGIKRESQLQHVRTKAPNASFMTNNFVIHRKVLEEIKFDERITGYGHEDTLFGFHLKKKGIVIKHIDNPVLNSYIENNNEYLEKTEKGISNLVAILNYIDDKNEFIQDVSLLKTYEKIAVLQLTGIIYFCFLLSKPIIKLLLAKGIISLQLFAFYKLGILIKNIKRQSVNTNQ